jgi:hypothetical protein
VPDYRNLNGQQRAALVAALVDAFGRSDLRMILNRLDKSWENVASEGGTKELQFLEVVARSQRDGWIGDLIKAIQAKSPHNSQIARLNVTLGLMQPALPPDRIPGAQVSLERAIPTSEIKKFAD